MHYKFCKEYHPELFAIVKKRVKEGRWKLAGSWINAVDTHIPSAESLFRQALYGQRFYRQEFGIDQQRRVSAGLFRLSRQPAGDCRNIPG